MRAATIVHLCLFLSILVSDQVCAAQDGRPVASNAAEEMTRTRLRRDMLDMISSACARRFPDHAPRYQTAFADWRAARKEKLDLADKSMLTDTSRADADQVAVLAALEQKQLQAWQVATTGAPLSRAPLIEDCDKLADAMAMVE